MRTLIITFLVGLFFQSGVLAAAEPDSCHVNGDGETAQEKAKNDDKCKCVSYYKTDENTKRVYWANKDGFDYSYCIELQETVSGQDTAVGRTGIDLVSRYISLLYKYGASIIGVICVLVIVVSGVQISMGGANSEFVNQGKERILQAIFSLILLFCSALILKVVNPGFFI